MLSDLWSHECQHLVQVNVVTPQMSPTTELNYELWLQQHPPCTFQETQPAEDSKYTREEEI